MTTRIIQGQVVVLDYIFNISEVEVSSPFADSGLLFFGGPNLIPNKKLLYCCFSIYGIDKSAHKIMYNYDDIVNIDTPISAYLTKLKEYSDSSLNSSSILILLKPQINDITNHITEFANSKIKEITDILANIKPIKTL